MRYIAPNTQECKYFYKLDYDGDTCTIKPIYTDEANAELDKVMHSNFNMVDMGGKPIRNPGNEAYQSLYNLTLRLPTTTGTSIPKF